jgi:hypothetical protein
MKPGRNWPCRMACDIYALDEVTGSPSWCYLDRQKDVPKPQAYDKLKHQSRKKQKALLPDDGSCSDSFMQSTFELAGWLKSGHPFANMLHQALRGDLVIHGKAGSADAGP